MVITHYDGDAVTDDNADGDFDDSNENANVSYDDAMMMMTMMIMTVMMEILMVMMRNLTTMITFLSGAP